LRRRPIRRGTEAARVAGDAREPAVLPSAPSIPSEASTTVISGPVSAAAARPEPPPMSSSRSIGRVAWSSPAASVSPSAGGMTRSYSGAIRSKKRTSPRPYMVAIGGGDT